GRFTDVSAGSGLDVAGFGMGVAAGDVNNDGFTDLLVTEYERVRLFLNQGNGTFREITKQSGIEDSHWAISAAFFDYDRDGWLDILVANDAKPNTLWINRRDGTFKNEAASRGIAYNEMGTAQANMGIAVGDINASGLFSIYITHLSEENNVLWMQDRPGLFQ